MRRSAVLLALVVAAVAATPAQAASVTRLHVSWTPTPDTALSPYVLLHERTSGALAQVECNSQATLQCRYGALGAIPSTHVEADGAHAMAIIDDDPAAGRSFCATVQSSVASATQSFTG